MHRTVLLAVIVITVASQWRPIYADSKLSRREADVKALVQTCERYRLKNPGTQITKWEDFEGLIVSEKIQEFSKQYALIGEALSLPSDERAEVLLIDLSPVQRESEATESRAFIYRAANGQFISTWIGEPEAKDFLRAQGIELTQSTYRIDEAKSPSTATPTQSLQNAPPPTPKESPKPPPSAKTSPPTELSQAEKSNTLLYVVLGLVVVVAIVVVVLRKARKQ